MYSLIYKMYTWEKFGICWTVISYLIIRQNEVFPNVLSQSLYGSLQILSKITSGVLDLYTF